MTENLLDIPITLDGITRVITGHVVARIHDVAQQIVYTFIKGDAGGNYLIRKGICSCCQELEEDAIQFDSWEELKERIGDFWLLETVARSMCELRGIH